MMVIEMVMVIDGDGYGDGDAISVHIDLTAQVAIIITSQHGNHCQNQLLFLLTNIYNHMKLPEKL